MWSKTHNWCCTICHFPTTRFRVWLGVRCGKCGFLGFYGTPVGAPLPEVNFELISTVNNIRVMDEYLEFLGNVPR